MVIGSGQFLYTNVALIRGGKVVAAEVLSSKSINLSGRNGKQHQVLEVKFKTDDNELTKKVNLPRLTLKYLVSPAIGEKIDVIYAGKNADQVRVYDLVSLLVVPLIFLSLGVSLLRAGVKKQFKIRSEDSQ